MSTEQVNDGVVVDETNTCADSEVAKDFTHFHFATTPAEEIHYTLEALIKVMEERVAHYNNPENSNGNKVNHLCPVLLGGTGHVISFKTADNQGNVGFTVPNTPGNTREFINKIKAQYTWDTKDSLVWITLTDKVKIAVTNLLMESLYSSIAIPTKVGVILNIEGI